MLDPRQYLNNDDNQATLLSVLFLPSLSSLDPEAPPSESCQSKMVAVESIKCEVEYDRSCRTGKKTVEYVSGYRRGDCRQIVKEKCYRRKVLSYSHSSHYHKRSPAASRDPEICDESKQVVCQKVPVYQEEIKDVEVCQVHRGTIFNTFF